MNTFGGTLGEIFAALSFSGALVAALSFLFAERRNELEKSNWEKLGKIGWVAHVTGVCGVIVTLFYLIYTHQYQYYYVFDHSSNELPVYYMISCFWEGQEGSFLLWTFWHAVLGSFIMLRKSEWRNVVMAVVSSVNLILASMILGVYVPVELVKVIFAIALLAPAAWLVYRSVRKGAQGTIPLFRVAAAMLALSAFYLLLSEKGGGLELIAPWKMLQEGADPAWVAAWIFGLVAGVLFIFELQQLIRDTHNPYRGMEALAGFAVLAFCLMLMLFPVGEWKIGSTPFMLLRDAMPEAPVFARNPDFIPVNGNGLNSLLQNYWMVIHPPTLFLGFASTTIPFAFVIGGMLRKKYSEWIKPALPWLLFAALVLGTGIIMGGYWAYETLNFGGYWNWDAVENSSFVPWLAVIIAIHSILLYRKSKAFLRTALLMTAGGFILVLYSTFLTRSGILGETSVHTFTDLGLSGQLLVLLFFYLFSVAILFAFRWKETGNAEKVEVSIYSADFLLFIGINVIIISAIGITLVTSIPVINNIFGTEMAPPNHPALFYYEENVWLAILLALLSGAAQFFFWNRKSNAGKKTVGEALLRPFMVAVITASILIVAGALGGLNFTFEDEFNQWLTDASAAESIIDKIINWVSWVLFAFADEILLAASIFMVLSNLDILIYLIRKNAAARKSIGGTLAHTGFGLMLVGMLYSSGFDSIVSINPNEKELSNFPEQEKNDNILLVKDQSRFVPGYQVTYLGELEAQPPVRDLEVIQDAGRMLKVAFYDNRGDRFAYEIPEEIYRKADGTQDFDAMKAALDDKVEFLRPERINNRNLYAVQFTPMRVYDNGVRWEVDSAKSFVLYPEAEFSGKMNDIIAHPSRKIFLTSDLYVHVSSLPEDEKDKEPELRHYTFDMAIGDTARTASGLLHLNGVQADDTTGKPYALIAKAQISVDGINGKTYNAAPVYRIDKTDMESGESDYVHGLRSFYYFMGVDINTGKVRIRVDEDISARQEFIVMKAIKKPWINILWLGTLVMLSGFGVAVARRRRENRQSLEGLVDENE